MFIRLTPFPPYTPKGESRRPGCTSHSWHSYDSPNPPLPRFPHLSSFPLFLDRLCCVMVFRPSQSIRVLVVWHPWRHASSSVLSTYLC